LARLWQNKNGKSPYDPKATYKKKKLTRTPWLQKNTALSTSIGAPVQKRKPIKQKIMTKQRSGAKGRNRKKAEGRGHRFLVRRPEKEITPEKSTESISRRSFNTNQEKQGGEVAPFGNNLGMHHRKQEKEEKKSNQPAFLTKRRKRTPGRGVCSYHSLSRRQRQSALDESSRKKKKGNTALPPLPGERGVASGVSNPGKITPRAPAARQVPKKVKRGVHRLFGTPKKKRVGVQLVPDRRGKKTIVRKRARLPKKKKKKLHPSLLPARKDGRKRNSPERAPSSTWTKRGLLPNKPEKKKKAPTDALLPFLCTGL